MEGIQFSGTPYSNEAKSTEASNIAEQAVKFGHCYWETEERIRRHLMCKIPRKRHRCAWCTREPSSTNTGQTSFLSCITPPPPPPSSLICMLHGTNFPEENKGEDGKGSLRLYGASQPGHKTQGMNPAHSRNKVAIKITPMHAIVNVWGEIYKEGRRVNAAHSHSEPRRAPVILSPARKFPPVGPLCCSFSGIFTLELPPATNFIPLFRRVP